MLERTHDFFTVIEAVTSARKAGFDNLNLDLIYGLPEQTLQTWQTTIKRILDLHPEHISAYALTLEQAHRLDDGHPKDYSLSPTLISPQKCTNGQVKHSKQWVCSI
jgi:coproporphyrinogen III oxidase-like Fe-S oxidoreductase